MGGAPYPLERHEGNHKKKKKKGAQAPGETQVLKDTPWGASVAAAQGIAAQPQA